jgi:hypothetical protein
MLKNGDSIIMDENQPVINPEELQKPNNLGK